MGESMGLANNREFPAVVSLVGVAYFGNVGHLLFLCWSWSLILPSLLVAACRHWCGSRDAGHCWCSVVKHNPPGHGLPARHPFLVFCTRMRPMPQETALKLAAYPSFLRVTPFWASSLATRMFYLKNASLQATSLICALISEPDYWP